MLAATALAGPAIADDGKTHQLVIHVNENDPRLFNEILTNINNLEKHYQSLDEDIVFRSRGLWPRA